MHADTRVLPAPFSGNRGTAPLLSVVMPTHNRLHLVTRALQALAEQVGVAPGAFEVVLVVDGSSDGTTAAVSNASLPFPLRVIEQTRSGAAVARNKGWRAAAGDVILFQDDDIIARPAFLAEHLRMHQEHPGAVVLGRLSRDHSLAATPWRLYEEAIQEKVYAAFAKHEAPSGIRLYTGNVSMPRALLERVNGFDTTLPLNEDVDLGLRLHEAGAEFVFAPAAEAFHCNEHDFSSWLRQPRVYGRLDVHLYRTKGYAGGVTSVVACYHDRHVLNRLAVRAALLHPSLHRALVGAGRWMGMRVGSWRSQRLARVTLSPVWNILYWTGIRDGLGGNQEFWAMIRATRGSSARPYRRRVLPRRR